MDRVELICTCHLNLHSGGETRNPERQGLRTKAEVRCGVPDMVGKRGGWRRAATKLVGTEGGGGGAGGWRRRGRRRAAALEEGGGEGRKSGSALGVAVWAGGRR